jgi:hypothetical protein
MPRRGSPARRPPRRPRRRSRRARPRRARPPPSRGSRRRSSGAAGAVRASGGPPRSPRGRRAPAPSRRRASSSAGPRVDLEQLEAALGAVGAERQAPPRAGQRVRRKRMVDGDAAVVRRLQLLAAILAAPQVRPEWSAAATSSAATTARARRARRSRRPRCDVRAQPLRAAVESRSRAGNGWKRRSSTCAPAAAASMPRARSALLGGQAALLDRKLGPSRRRDAVERASLVTRRVACRRTG